MGYFISFILLCIVVFIGLLIRQEIYGIGFLEGKSNVVKVILALIFGSAVVGFLVYAVLN
tara:strand:- start:49 stop:228 length:180 start_codon:yes stop_codon:yes gene_type:complete